MEIIQRISGFDWLGHGTIVLCLDETSAGSISISFTLLQIIKSFSVQTTGSCAISRQGLFVIASSLGGLCTALFILTFLMYLRLSKYSNFYKGSFFQNVIREILLTLGLEFLIAWLITGKITHVYGEDDEHRIEADGRKNGKDHGRRTPA